jgi:hypothetical protein
VNLTTTINNNPVETGCYCEGHRGWHGTAHVINLAVGFGFELDAEGQDAVDRYDSCDETDDPDLFEVVAGQGGICDEAVAWMNEHTSSICGHCFQPVHLTDSGEWYVHDGLPTEMCPRFSDTALHFVWHWHDGEFFLSPTCHGQDCEQPECASCWSD